MNRNVTLIVFGVIATVITLGAGYLTSGGSTAELMAVTQRVEQMPKEIPNWELASSENIDENSRRTLECTGYFVRRYIASKTGDRIIAAVLVGPCGPMSLHNPNVCYDMAGYTETRPMKKESFKVGDAEVKLWTTVMEQKKLGEKIKIAWGWDDGNGFSAPETGRFAFAGRPYLVKVQVVNEVENRPGEDDKALERFMADFMPLLQKTLAQKNGA